MPTFQPLLSRENYSVGTRATSILHSAIKQIEWILFRILPPNGTGTTLV